jgi:hypothetical protein
MLTYRKEERVSPLVTGRLELDSSQSSKDLRNGSEGLVIIFQLVQIVQQTRQVYES